MLKEQQHITSKRAEGLNDNEKASRSNGGGGKGA